jgi:hypothetical protein
MTFGRGQQLPYRKRAPPPKTLARTKTARKKSRDHVKQEMEVDELPRDDDEFPSDDKDLDNAEDDDEEDEDEDDNDDEYNDEERPLTMEEKGLMGIDFVSQEEIRIAVKVLKMLTADY